MKFQLLKFTAAIGLTAAGVIGTGATTLVDAAGTVITGTQIAEPHICTNGPVIDGLLFTAAHCVRGNGWIEDESDVAIKPATGFDDSIYTTSGTIPVRGYVSPVVGMTVYKAGRTSGVTSGVVYNVSGGMWDAQGMQQCSGDSGAPAFTFIDGDAYIVGIATNGDGSVDAAGGAHHDKRCHNTSRPWDQYGAGGPTIDTMLAVASAKAPAIQPAPAAPIQPTPTEPPPPPATEPPPPPPTEPPPTEPPPPPPTEPPATEPPIVHDCRGLPATLVGTDGDDRIVGTDGDDVIVALGGNDTVEGHGGNDVICGGGGDDLIHGQSGDDVIDGGEGNDKLLGGTGDDEARGGPGHDIIIGYSGDDKIAGDDGDDHLYGGGGDDRIYAEFGDNLVHGGTGDDTIFRRRRDAECRIMAVTTCRR